MKEKLENPNDKNKLELEGSFQKEDFELEDNYSDILTLYWISMFYFPIYPIGIIQTFLNLLFKFLIENNFLLKSYKRPEYVTPHIEFFCLNSFNFGFFLLLIGNYFFFKNEDNKHCFGLIYFIVIIIILVIPFFYLPKFIMFIINYFCLKEKEPDSFENIEQKIKVDYKLMNLCGKKEGLKEIISGFKDKELLIESQYEELENKINLLNEMDFYKLQQRLRTPKEMIFEEKQVKSLDEIIPKDTNNIDSKSAPEKKFKSYNLEHIENINEIKNSVDYLLKNNPNEIKEEIKSNIISPKEEIKENEEKKSMTKINQENSEENNKKKEQKQKLYYLLMQLNLFSFLESGRTIENTEPPMKYETKVNKKSIRADSLKNSFLSEYITNCDSSIFTTYIQKGIFYLAYVENGNNIIIYKVFDKKVSTDVVGLKSNKKIVCLSFFRVKKTPYIVSLALDNTMTISELKENSIVNSIYISDIGETFEEKKENNIFCLSTVKHDNDDIWIITSYYYDRKFKIYNYKSLKNFFRTNIGETQKPKPLYTVENTQNNFIVSLEGLVYNDKYTYICVRCWSEKDKNYSLNLYLNETFIKQINDIDYTSYINFKTVHHLIHKCKYIIITIINKDLSSYILKIIDITPILPPNYTYPDLMVKQLILKQKLPSLNEKRKSPEEEIKEIRKISHIDICNFKIDLNGSDEQINKMKLFMTTNKNEKYNIGNILFWLDGYIMVCTPFNYIDIIDYKKEQKIAEIKFTNDIFIYNISERIRDPAYGYSFIINDNRGKIHYIRPTKFKDKLNIKLIESKEYFNDLEDERKLNHILFSIKFYYRYSIISYLGPFIAAICGHKINNDSADNKILYTIAGLFYVVYGFFGLWFKSCVYDINDESHTGRSCTKFMMYLCIMLKMAANIMISYQYCLKNKTGVYFFSALFGIFMIYLFLNMIIYRCQKKHLLRTYLLGYIFYYTARICILLFFLLSLFFKANYVETYIYAGILCIIMAYMFMANYFSTLMKNITYHSYLQAIFNYPMEWLNLFCCFCTEPKRCIKEVDTNCCCFDSCFIWIAECLLLLVAFIIGCILMCINKLIVCVEECITGKKIDEEDQNNEEENKKIIKEKTVEIEQTIDIENQIEVDENIEDEKPKDYDNNIEEKNIDKNE